MVNTINPAIVAEAASRLIPHSTPMLMVEKIISVNDSLKSSRLKTTILESNPFLDETGTLLPSVYLELISQGAAAQHGFNLIRDGRNEEEGFLVGVRDFNVYGDAFLGDVLTIEVALGVEIESLSVVRGTVRKKDETVMAEAEITVWHGTP
ncbi:MAG: 3-hydroxyacyl-ACP dehydratase [Kiritimatiellaeota bacterium]|nr:3-hydroxyacyl-ACP dehydratase [Kiritimatiellota bacterium]